MDQENYTNSRQNGNIEERNLEIRLVSAIVNDVYIFRELRQMA